MVTLTWLYGIAEYICFNEGGNSVVDHICIDRRSRELVETLMTREEVMGRIDTDHSMVVARLKIKVRKTEEGEDKRGSHEDELKKNRKKRKALNRIKEKSTWEKYESKVEKSEEITDLILWMEEASQNMEAEGTEKVERWWGRSRR